MAWSHTLSRARPPARTSDRVLDGNDYREDAKNVHFTNGGPYFEKYRNDDYAEEWFAARERLLFVQQGA